MKRPIALALTSAALAAALSVALRPSAGAPDFVQFLGRFHTLAVHLPIGVLLLVAAAEALCLASPRARARLDPALDLALPVLVVTSVAAFALGLLLARGGGYPSRLVALHRGFTLAAVIGSAACLIAWALERRNAYRGALGVTVLLLTVGAHYGGSMTRGDAYLVRYAPRFVQELLGEAPRKEASPGDAAQVVGAEPLVFADVLLPMLAQRCAECHGADQAKGGLRLDSFAALARGGEHGPVILAGRGGASSLVERMTLPAGNDERMPPDDKPAPSPEEIQLVRWWIDRGASESTRVRDGVVPDGARALLSKVAVVASSPDVVEPPKPAPSAVAPPPSSSPTSAPVAVTPSRAGPRLVWRDVVAPLLAARCASCHGGAKQKGKLRVDSIEALLAGGKNGAAVVPGNASGGTLLARSHLPLDDEKHMPPAKEPQLDAAQIELVAWWITGGASATLTADAMPSRFAKLAPVSAATTKVPISPASSATASAEPPSPPQLSRPAEPAEPAEPAGSAAITGPDLSRRARIYFQIDQRPRRDRQVRGGSLRCRIADAAHEEDHPRADVAEEEEERVICVELHLGRWRRRPLMTHHHSGRGGRFGPILVELDESLVEDVIDRERRGGDASEVGLVRIERERHPQRLERGLERERARRLNLEPGKRDINAIRGQRTKPRLERGRGESRLHRVEPVFLIWQHQRHRQCTALIKHLQNLHAIRRRKAEQSGLVHCGDIVALRRGEMKRGCHCQLFREGAAPAAEEIDRVGEHEACGSGHAFRGKEILDALLGGGADPRVDVLPASVELMLKIYCLHRRAERGPRDVEIRRFKGTRLFDEEPVGNAKRHTQLRILVAREQLAVEIERLRERAALVEHLLHLLRCLAAGTGPGHGQGGREAERGERQVALLRAKLGEEVEPKGVVAPGEPLELITRWRSHYITVGRCRLLHRSCVL